MKKKAIVLLNPKAGGGRAIRAWAKAEPLIAQAFEEVETWPSNAPGHATELARRAVAQDPAAIVGVGGDGTIHEIVNGMATSQVPLGILPFGTGNDFARALAIPRNLQGSSAVILGGRTRRVDLGRVHGQYYVQVAGTGFDAVVAQRVNAGGRAGSGALTYIGHLLATLVSYRNSETMMQIGASGASTVKGRVLLLAVANTAYYAGGMKVCPGATPDDGQLDWCRIGDLTKLEVLGALPRVFGGSHVRMRKISTGRASSVDIEGPADMPVHADGELVGFLPARFDCVPDALTVFVP